MKMSEVWPAPVFINCDKSGSGTGLCDPNESIPTHILPFYWKKVFQGHKNQGNPSVFHPHMGSDNGTKNPGSPHEGKKRFPKTLSRENQDQQLPLQGHQGFSSLIFAGNFWNDSRVFFTSPSSRGPIQGGNYESLGNVCSGWTLNFPPPGDEALGDSWVTATP